MCLCFIKSRFFFVMVKSDIQLWEKKRKTSSRCSASDKNPPVFPESSSALRSHCSSRAGQRTSVPWPLGLRAPCGLLGAVGPSQTAQQRAGSRGDEERWNAPCSPGWHTARSETHSGFCWRVCVVLFFFWYNIIHYFPSSDAYRNI